MIIIGVDYHPSFQTIVVNPRHHSFWNPGASQT
jgi:hypothetical protein